MLKSAIERVVKNIVYFTKNEILCAIENHQIMELFRKAQSSNNIERVLAKAKLKKFYPEVYSELN